MSVVPSNVVKFLALSVAGVLLVGCASDSSKTAPADRVDTATKGAPDVRPDAMSYGAVKSTVKTNVTTQADLIQMFGGPNITTTDAEGVETWMYEKKSSSTDTASQQEQANFQAFFGGGAVIGPAAVGGGATGGKTSSNGQRSTSYTEKTLTVFIKWNKDSTVKSCSVRASQF